MVTQLNSKEVEWLLEAYTLEEILEHSNLTQREVLEFLLESGWLYDLPEELIPVVIDGDGEYHTDEQA